MTVNAYNIGQLVRFIAPFVDIAGAPADPSTIELKINDPLGTVLTVTFAGGQIVRDSLGVYHYDFLTVLPGRHALHWAGTGAVQAPGQEHFFVLRNFF